MKLLLAFKSCFFSCKFLSFQVGENGETIEEVYEPFLIQEGFIMRTPRGREVTELAYKHLNRVKGKSQGELF